MTQSRARALRLASAPIGIAFGLAVEWAFYDPALGRRLAAADFVVGSLLFVAGAVAWDRREKSRIGPLMTLAGLCWFVGNVSGLLVYLHRGPLVHMVLSYPSGRLRGRLARIVVAGAYLDGMIEPLARRNTLTLLLAGSIAVASCRLFVTSSGPARTAAAPALYSGLALSGALALAASARLDALGHRDAVLVVYDLTVASITVVLLVDLLRGRWAERAVGGLVVDLGETSDAAGLRARLARALGDPSLQLGYRLADSDGFVDDAGEPLVLPARGSGRTVTALEDSGEQIGVLVHDDVLLADPALIEAVAAAAQLALANARLQAEARTQAAELDLSRRRIVEATDRQQRRLEEELRAGPERLLEQAAVGLSSATAEVGDDGEGISALAAELARARTELRRFAQGVRPTALSEGGLMPALSVLARQAPLPVAVRGGVKRLPEAVEAALYFVCSEGVTNAAKHARASHVTIEVHERDGTAAVVTVADDGVGGARLSAGGGLRGLSDRVEALGGVLAIESRPGIGTCLVAEVPAILGEPVVNERGSTA